MPCRYNGKVCHGGFCGVHKRQHKTVPKKYALVLFCGTKSVDRVLEAAGYTVISLDINKKVDPTILSDILKWDYTEFPRGYFDTIWASPLCTEYSKAKTKGVRNLELADSLVLRTLEIIKHFNPRQWFIENPQTGLLKTRSFMAGLTYYDADYCKYGFTYRKRTRFWTNKPNLKLSLCNKDCGMMDGNKHINSCGNGNKCYCRDTITLDQKYSIPPNLIKALALG